MSSEFWLAYGGPNVSALIATLARVSGMSQSAIDADTEAWALFNSAANLCAPIDDWESAAREAGWTTDEDTGNGVRWTRAENDLDRANEDGPPYCDTAQQACEFDHIEPHQREVYSHWIVSTHLAGHLSRRGEKGSVIAPGIAIWSRTRDMPPEEDPVIIAICTGD